MGAGRGIGMSYNLALNHCRRGDLLVADLHLEQAAEAFASQGAVSMQSRVLSTLGSILVSMGRFDELAAVLEKINGLNLEDPVELSRLHALRGDHALATGRNQTALDEFQAAHGLVSGTDARSDLLVARLNVARAELALGSSVQA